MTKYRQNSRKLAYVGALVLPDGSTKAVEASLSANWRLCSKWIRDNTPNPLDHIIFVCTAFLPSQK
jgi:hypothetical protein